MSTRRGGASKGKPKHQNKFGFKHNKNSKKTKMIQVMPIEGVCPRCAEILMWRKKYRKYKPRTKPGKCIKCHEPKVRHAYHQLCSECAKGDRKCAKCSGPIRGERPGDGTAAASLDPLVVERKEALESELDSLVEASHPDYTERQRRARIREIQKELEVMEEKPEVALEEALDDGAAGEAGAGAAGEAGAGAAVGGAGASESKGGEGDDDGEEGEEDGGAGLALPASAAAPGTGAGAGDGLSEGAVRATASVAGAGAGAEAGAGAGAGAGVGGGAGAGIGGAGVGGLGAGLADPVASESSEIEGKGDDRVVAGDGTTSAGGVSGSESGMPT